YSIYCCRMDFQTIAHTVPVPNRAFEKIRKRGQTNVRVRRHIQILIYGHTSRPHMVDEDKGSYHALLFKRKQTSFHKISNICRTLLYYEAYIRHHNALLFNPDYALDSLYKIIIASNPLQQLKNHNLLCFILYFVDYLP